MLPTLLALLLAPAADPLELPRPFLDAGEILAGPPLARRFPFRNRGSEPLTITDLQASCGCLTPTLARRTYAPGESGELTLEVNTLSQPEGPVRWRLRVGYRSGGATGEAAVELCARLVREIRVEPAALVLRSPGGRTAVVTVSDDRPHPLTVTALSVSSPRLRAELHGTTAEVRAADDCPEGEYREFVYFTTDDPHYSELKVPVTVIHPAKQRVTAAPNRVTLAGGASALVQLRDAEGQAVEVEAIDVDGPLTCRWAAGPGHFATVRIGPKATAGTPAGTVRVKLKSPAGQTVVIPVTGE